MRVGDKVWVLARAEQATVLDVRRGPPSWEMGHRPRDRYEVIVRLDSTGENRWYWLSELELVHEAGTRQGGSDGS